MGSIILLSPLAGWSMPLAEIPDPVFAARMAGDGVGIDPTGSSLHAPCDGEVVLMQGAQHALTLRVAGGPDFLLHVGIDTVQLGGIGFTLLVRHGELVRAGQALLRFDLDLIARRARSAVTPILLASEGIIRRRSENCAVEIGDFLMEIEVVASRRADVAPDGPSQTLTTLNRWFRVPFDHGLHARPAAQLAAVLRPFSAAVSFRSRDRHSNARSTVATMALGIARDEIIECTATGSDAAEALAALATLLVLAEPPIVAATGSVNGSRAGAPILPKISTAPAAQTIRLPAQIKAVIASRGAAQGVAVQLALPEMAVLERGGERATEVTSLDSAIATVKSAIESLLPSATDAQQTIFSAHVELVQDPELLRQTHDWIAQGKSAAWGWRQATRTMMTALQSLDDQRMHERAADLRDIEDQVIRALSGLPAITHQLPASAILLADEILPSQLLTLDRNRIVGFCSARGGPTAHVAIIAASMGIPALVAAGSDVLAIRDGTRLILDADRGRLDIDPSADTCRAFETELQARRAQYAIDLRSAHDSCETTDHVPMAVFANLGSVAEAAAAVAQGAEGCGLLRSEFLFQERRLPPDENEQARQYQEITDAMAGRVLTIRTLDMGGDKPIDYLPMPHEANPALGLRGLRTSLWRPDLLHTQLRAILRVTPASKCRILLPMVTDLADVRAVREVLATLQIELGLTKLPALGVMIETPASALLADQLAREVDFLSIGSNDLSQYTLAMDRAHPELAAKLDGLHPAVLRLIARAAVAAQPMHKEVAVCGGLASDLAAIPILVGLGIHELSVVPASIPRIKGLIRSLDSRACRKLANAALEKTTAAEVRQLVAEWPQPGLHS